MEQVEWVESGDRVRSAAERLFAGPGAARALARSVDWAATALGPVDRWPQSLRTAADLCLASQFATALLWGPERVLIHNDAHIPLLGARYPGAMGRPASEVLSDTWPVLAPIVARTLAVGDGAGAAGPVAVRLMFDRGGEPRPGQLTVSFSAVRDEAGHPAGVLISAVDMTARVHAEAALRESEEKYRSIVESMEEALALCEGVFDADGRLVDYRWLEVNAAQERRMWAPRVESIGTLRSASPLPPDPELMKLFAEVVATGRPRRTERYSVAMDAWVSVTCVPMGADRFVSLVSDISERKRQERRQRFLLELTDALRPLSDARDIQRAAIRVLGEHLQVDRTFYTEFEPDGREYVIADDYVRDGTPTRVGRFPADPFSNVIRWFARGDTVLIPDVRQTTVLSDAEKAASVAAGLVAIIGVPLIKGDRLVAQLGVQHRRPRAWTADEIAIVQEAAERTWAAVERARAEAALRESEARYRTLFETIDEGFCIVELVYDGGGRLENLVLRQVNESFERHTGLRDVVGQELGGIVPNLEQHWIDAFDRVAKTGHSERSENYVQDIGRWYRVHLSRVGDAGSRLVALVFEDVSERVRAEAALRESERQQAFLLEMSDALRVQPSAEAIENLVVRSLAEELNADTCYIAHTSRKEHLGRVGPEYRAPGLPSLVGEYRYADFPDTVRRAETESLLIPDVANEPALSDVDKASIAGMGMAAMMVAHMRRGEKESIYAITVGSSTPRSWTRDDLRLVEELTERTWAAVERTHAESALRASQARQAFLLELSDALRPLVDPVAIQGAAAHRLGEYLGVSRALYYAVEPSPEGYVHVVEQDFYRDPEMPSLVGRFPLAAFGEGLTAPLSGGGVVAVDDVAAAPGVTADEVLRYRAIRCEAFVAVPLVKHDRYVAGLVVEHAVPRAWSAHDVTLIEAVAERTWSAVERARAEVALRETQARLEAALATARMAYWDWDPATDAVVASASMDELFGLPPGERLASSTRTLEIVHPDDRERHRALVEGSSARGEGWHNEFRIVRPRDGALVWVEERATVTRDPVSGAPHATALVWDISDRKRAEAVAELERNARERDALRRELVEAEEAERRRLARELHDQLGQQLTALTLGLEDAKRLAATHDGRPGASDTPLLRRLEQLTALGRATTMAARYVALELRPPELDDMGLENALETYANEWSARYGIAAEFIVVGDAREPLPADVGSALYRIVQEALTNVAKHARARAVSVIVERTEHDVRLIVEDDGRGFDVPEATARARRERRLGIAGIQERAALLGGSARMESSGDNGTTVFVRVPLVPDGGDVPRASETANAAAPLSAP